MNPTTNTFQFNGTISKPMTMEQAIDTARNRVLKFNQTVTLKVQTMRGKWITLATYRPLPKSKQQAYYNDGKDKESGIVPQLDVELACVTR